MHWLAEHGFLSTIECVNDAVYLFEGTLIFTNPVDTSLYTHRVFLNSPWVDRVARMRRRHMRKEVFGATVSEREEYVGFLCQEAKSCADAEVFAQLGEGVILITSNTKTVSGLLDLLSLWSEMMRNPSLASIYILNLSEVEDA